MVHLTYAQRESLKKAVLTCNIHRLTIAETQQYVKTRLGFDMSLDYIWRLRASLKNDRKKHFEDLQKDRYTFLDESFFKRVAELENNQTILHNIIYNNADNPEAQIKAVTQLNEITVLIHNLFETLPSITKLGIDAFVSNDNNNNFGSTLTPKKGVDEVVPIG